MEGEGPPGTTASKEPGRWKPAADGGPAHPVSANGAQPSAGARPSSLRPGLTVFFTGLSGAGKSTLASLLAKRLTDRSGQSVTLLDGDAVRKSLAGGGGYTRSERRSHVIRVGALAERVTRDGGIAVCALIAPYDDVRREVRAMVAAAGTFVLVHVATPLAVCERRDPKGLYAGARAGTVPHFTGISDPYEVPADAEISIDLTSISAEDAVDSVMTWLHQRDLLPAGVTAG